MSNDHEDRNALLTEMAEKYPDKYLLCRDMGHSWKPQSAVWLEDGNIERTITCSRCNTLRRQYLDANGYILVGYYSYADGYQIAGIGRMDTDARAGLRKASLSRLMK